MADAAVAAPAPGPDLMTSILPAGGVDANALDASFTLVRRERAGAFFSLLSLFLFFFEREDARVRVREEGKKEKGGENSPKKMKKLKK